MHSNGSAREQETAAARVGSFSLGTLLSEMRLPNQLRRASPDDRDILSLIPTPQAMCSRELQWAAQRGQERGENLPMSRAIFSALRGAGLCVALSIGPVAGASAQTTDLDYQQALQRGTQAVVWGMPAVGLIGIRQSAQRDLGATFNDIIYMSSPPAPRQALLTPTNQTPYVVAGCRTGDAVAVHRRKGAESGKV